jgi:hypothetical protein
MKQYALSEINWVSTETGISVLHMSSSPSCNLQCGDNIPSSRGMRVHHWWETLVGHAYTVLFFHAAVYVIYDVFELVTF